MRVESGRHEVESRAGASGRWSSRVPPALEPNRLARAIEARRAAGAPLIDLTTSNPSVAAIPYPEGLLAQLGTPAGLCYRPDAAGDSEARRAVAADFARRGTHVEPERILLTASTSEAYSTLFKALCNPGDEVLVPAPSYPLFEHLARLDAVRIRQYGLAYDGHWHVAWDTVDPLLSPRTRAVLIVSPNNPTGSFLRAGDHARWLGICAARDLAVIVDEVFCDYRLDVAADAVSCALEEGNRASALTFVLGGLSKSVGVPSVKLGWMAWSAPDRLAAEARERLELIGDTYLSVSTPVQLAAPVLLRDGAVVREAIRARIRSNLDRLAGCVAALPACSLLAVEGGWSAVVRVPAVVPEEDLVVRLVDEAGVLVHPGYFFDFTGEAFLVTSLLPEHAVFDEGWARVADVLGALV